MKRVPLKRVRLSEIPFDRRMIGARVALRHAESPEERQDIMIAALFPSDRVYYVSAASDDEQLRAAA